MAASFRGMAGNGVPSSLTIFNKVKAYLQSWLLRFAWNDFEPTAGNYVYSYIEDYVTLLANADLDLIILPLVAPANTGTTPAWLFSPPYNVPLVTTDRGTYPYYLDPVFIARKQAMHDAIRNRIKNTWSTDWKNRLNNWQSAEGSTGDEGPYKGTITKVTINGVIQANPSLYNITNDQWNTYKRTQVWPQMYALLAADIPNTNLLINPANDGQNSQWSETNTPNSGQKYGYPGHNFNNCGELQYSARGMAITAILPKVLIRSELEGTPDDTWWNKQCLLPLIAGYACHGGTALCITLTVINKIIDVDAAGDYWIFDFGNAHLGFRNVADTNQGFIVLRDIIDGYDVARFPQATYGGVIDPLYSGVYSTKYNQINNNPNLPQSVKDDRITNLIVQYFNPARTANLQAALPNNVLLNLSTDQDHDSYGSDFGINMIPDNYSRFIIQYSPNTTSTGYNRIGLTTQFHGRTCRAGAEQQFYFDSGLIGNATYNMTFKEIWYYDEGVSTWALFYYNGSAKVSAGTQTNGGTNTWKKYTVTLTDLQGGGQLTNSCDFTLKTLSGTDTKFELIWAVRNSTSSTGTAGTYILGTASLTVCVNDPQTLYTNGSFAIGKILFYDGNMSDPVIGFGFAVNNNNIYNIDGSNGEVLSDTGTDCTLGTAGTYKLGNTLSSICNASSGMKYTNGDFAPGKILYSNAALTSAVTTFSYVVDTTTGIAYNINSSNGTIGAPTTVICGGGTSGNYRTGTDILTICLSDLVELFTNDIFGIGVFLFEDINLSIPLVGISYIVNIENDYIYTVDISTGQVTGLTNQNCNASNYIPAADDFSVSVSQFIKDCGCEGDCDCP